MPRPLVFWTVAAAAVAAAVVQAWVLRWTCDDAFISFRYARHLVEGHGLVFNLDPSEPPVEGYTNFVWTLWCALGLWLGGASDAFLETWTIGWGIAAHGGTVALLAAIAWRASGGRAVVPIAACGYAAIHHAASLAPAGLETALFVLLVTAMLRTCLEPITPRRALWLAGLGVLAATTRPDGAIPCAMAGLFVLADAVRGNARVPAWRPIVAFAVPFVCVLGPYLLWRHAYYGYWLPNTFYAKSGSDPFVSQGFRYVRDFVLCYWPLLLACVPLLVFAARGPAADATADPRRGRRPWLAVGAFVASYVAFVLWVGGDFMFGRFLLPILPALLLAFDFLAVRWRAVWLQPVLGAIVVLGCVFRVEPPDLDRFDKEVSDNRRISFLVLGGHPLVDVARGIGEYMQRLFAGLDVRLGISGAHANLAYRARVPVAIECASGLTDAYIAHLPIPARGKRGHERGYWLYPGYLERRGVHFMLEQSYGKDDPWREVWFPAQPLPMMARLVTWDPELVRELKRRDPAVQIPDFEQFLDAYIADLPNKTKAQVAADYEKFKPFWFDHAGDPVRRAAFEAFLR